MDLKLKGKKERNKQTRKSREVTEALKTLGREKKKKVNSCLSKNTVGNTQRGKMFSS